ncbi:MAG: MFS transporter [Anaerolineae bacterium]|nr:MFS transporter [Anaerolineae bacterium]
MTSKLNPLPPITNADNWQPRFFSIFVGQSFSLIGSALTQFVLLWWITDVTGSPTALALAGIAGLLPQALFSPLGGALADRWSRRAILILADTITAACMVVLILLFAANTIELWHIYTLMFIRSSMQAFQQPAAAASTAMLVPEEWIPRVAGMNQTVFGIVTIAGAPLGALALAFLPFEGALAIDVATALLGLVPLFIFRIPQTLAQPSELTGILTELRDGVDYVTTRRGLLMLFAATGLVVLTIMPTFTLTPLLVKNDFNGGVNEVALMEGLSGIGIIIGGILIAIWPGFSRRVVTVLVFYALSCITVAITALMPADMILLAAFWWFVSGATFAMGNAPFTALLQLTVPNQMQGRVLSLLNTVVGFAGPVGLLLVAPLGEVVGVRGVFIIGGVLSTLVCVAALFSPSLLRVEEEPAYVN